MVLEGMASGSRLPSWKERENNKRRERRRRAIAAKIYSGLRMYGNFKLPKHCDNNEVLKALCREAGWVVEEDGTTYRKGCKPVERMDIMGVSESASPSSSYQPSPCTSYNPSPPSSAIPTPVSSRYNPNPITNADPNSLIPWLKNLSSGPSSSNSAKIPNHLYIHSGSISAPVTPPNSSPAGRTPRAAAWAAWAGENQAFLPNSMPPSPGLSGAQTPLEGPTSPISPTFSLVSPNVFGFKDAVSGSGSRMWTPGQSGVCSPVVGVGYNQKGDVRMSDVMGSEFAFGSSVNGLVMAWEGERIHEECVADDLELKL